MNGEVGTAYAQRTDLHNNPMPVEAAPNQGYGKAGAQRQSQRIIPVSPQQIATSALPTNAPNAPSAPSTPAAPAPGPGDFLFTHPTERPGEPTTHGLPSGLGDGPEALNLPLNSQQGLANSIRSLGQDPFASEGVKALTSLLGSV